MENKDLTIDNVQINMITLQKMTLIFNALNSGWSVKKNKEKYIFYKQHKGEKEIFLDSYLARFLETNLCIDKLFDDGQIK